MTVYPPVTPPEQRNTRILQLFKLPVYGFALVYALCRLAGADTLAATFPGPTWYTVYAAATVFAIFTYKIDMLVAAFHTNRHLRALGINPQLLVQLALLIPLTCAGLDAVANNMDAPGILPVLSSLLAIPFFAFLSYGCIKGIADPYWPAANRKLLQQTKQARK